MGGSTKTLSLISYTNVSMTTFIIKIIALCAMLLDHIGLFFFPDIFWLRAVGRLSFPLFAWLIANGAFYTKNTFLYAKRLLLLALISQLPFFYTNRLINPSFEGINVVFTLFLGFVVISIIRKTSNTFIVLLAVCGSALFAQLLRFDYGALGILSIVAFYLFYHNFKMMLVSQIVLLLVFPYLVFFLDFTYHTSFSSYYLNSPSEFLGLFSLFFIALYNKKQGYKINYLFYLVYPFQYIVIAVAFLLFSPR